MVRPDRHRCWAEVRRKGLHGYDQGEGLLLDRTVIPLGGSKLAAQVADPPHPQPGTKLHPDKSRKHLPLQKTANHNWVVAVLEGMPNVTSGPRRQHWPLQTI